MCVSEGMDDGERGGDVIVHARSELSEEVPTLLVYR